MGVERIACLLQGVDNVYETDLLRPVIDEAQRLPGGTHGANPDDDIRIRATAAPPPAASSDPPGSSAPPAKPWKAS
jgi:tRNA synthetases class II (A)